MDTPNLPEPSPWLDLAAELRRIAYDFETLVGEPAPGYVTLDIQPGKALQAETPAMVDAVAAVLLRKTPETKKLVGGTYHRQASGSRGQIRVSVYQEVTSPPDERDAELARLRAENEMLRTATTSPNRHDKGCLGAFGKPCTCAPDGLDHSRPADSEDPQSLGARVPMHAGTAKSGITDNGARVHEPVVDAPVVVAPLLKLPMRDEKPRPAATFAERRRALDDRCRTAGRHVAPCSLAGSDL